MTERIQGLIRRLPSIAVYCGSSAGTKAHYAEAASALGRLMAEEHIRLVYGGGSRGLMGCVANGALAAGGEVTGVIPGFMLELEWGHRGVTELLTVETMQQRKQKIFELASGVIALPGGVGTLEEFSEILSWSQLLLHQKPIGFLNIDGYYDLFFRFMEHMKEEGFCAQSTLDLVVASEDPAELLRKMTEFRHHGRNKTLS